MEVVRAFDHGRLSEIWKSAEGQTDADRAIPAFEARISRIFIWTTLVIALAALIWWLPQNTSRAWFAFTAVLMVACPCALALAPPFTWNQVAAYFAGMGLFLRKPEYAGTLGEIRTIIFDKTGTLTDQEVIRAEVPATYSTREKEMLKTIASQSHHPYSQAIVHALNGYENLPVDHFREYPGKGSLAECSEDVLKLGGANWVAASTGKEDGLRKEIWFSINGRILEPVEMYSNYRPELAGVLKNLKKRGLRMILASGDSAVEQEKLQAVFPAVFSETHFHMSPAGKVSLLQKEQLQGKAAMVGDGLNDAGALKMADIGMVVTGDTNNFTPEASAILLRDSMNHLPGMLDTARKSNRIVKETFVVSLVYNAIALTLAATGHMSPLIAAILMPSSSIALMVYAWGRTKIMLGRKTKP
jgi:Cu+-exporting ATPase